VRRSLVAALLGMTLFGGVAGAHPLAPALLELTEVGPARYAVLWRTSVARAGSASVAPRLPADCAALAPADSRIEKGEALVARWVAQCAEGLAGRALAVDGLEGSGINVIVRLLPLGAPPFQALLGADQPAVMAPAHDAAGGEGVFARYLGLGAQHLVGGLDHALFLLGLFLLVAGRGARALVVTVTAFTLGHSVTLGLATAGGSLLRQETAELLIAGTVLLLALELVGARSGPAHPSLLARRPGWMAGAFGLVHGLGFAGALRDVGFPAGEIPLALLAFNVGIELGQLTLIAALAAGAWAWRRLPAAGRLAPAAPAYLIGSFAACWLLERSAMLLA
jgi:hypothetical protein